MLCLSSPGCCKQLWNAMLNLNGAQWDFGKISDISKKSFFSAKLEKSLKLGDIFCCWISMLDDFLWEVFPLCKGPGEPRKSLVTWKPTVKSQGMFQNEIGGLVCMLHFFDNGWTGCPLSYRRYLFINILWALNGTCSERKDMADGCRFLHLFVIHGFISRGKMAQMHFSYQFCRVFFGKSTL